MLEFHRKIPDLHHIQNPIAFRQLNATCTTSWNAARPRVFGTGATQALCTDAGSMTITGRVCSCRYRHKTWVVGQLFARDGHDAQSVQKSVYATPGAHKGIERVIEMVEA